MKDHTRLLNLALIRFMRGMLTSWEKWVNAEWLEDLPNATPEDALKALTPEKRLEDNRQ